MTYYGNTYLPLRHDSYNCESSKNRQNESLSQEWYWFLLILFLCTGSWWDIYKEIWDVIKCKILQILISLMTNNAESLLADIISIHESYPILSHLTRLQLTSLNNQTVWWGTLSEDLRLLWASSRYSLLGVLFSLYPPSLVRAGRQSRPVLPPPSSHS